MATSELLRLLQLVSPSLPVGAFAYSQGLEFAVEAGVVGDEQEVYAWVAGLLQENLGQLDLPIICRCYQALQNNQPDSFARWNKIALANRETSELRLESRQMAIALMRLLQSMDPGLANFRQLDLDWAAAFALAAQHWGIGLAISLEGYCWSWCENQIAAAIKLVPIGQTQGQILLLRLAEKIPTLVQQAQQVIDDDIGALAPAMVLASCRHETQYSRLFRS